MTYVVTGAAGFIGSRLVGALNRSGISEIIAVDNLEKSSSPRNLAGRNYRDYLHHREFLERFDGSFQAVFHQGACTDTTQHDRKLMMESNFEYSRQLLDKCQRAKVPLIYASSASVYGAGREFREDPACERPLNVYAESKLLFDQLVRGLRQPAAQVVGLRYFNVYGPSEAHKGHMASVAFHAFNQFKAEGRVKLFAGSGGYGDGEQRRDFVHVDDAVMVNLWMLERRDVSGIFNCGTGRAQTFNQVAAAVINTLRGTRASPQELAEAKLIQYIDFPPHLLGKYQSYTQADLSRLRAAGLPGEFMSVEDGVAAYVKDLMKQ